ncbi:hypothetical protein AGMMS49965_24880 [Bacteroidia bacterium]|nr:hypothetical protein AGMMS49965_24880 [Bacteroidia bacterium]
MCGAGKGIGVKKSMNILFLSDTHGKHRRLKNLPPADMLIHAGDVSRSGADYEVDDFMQWFGGWAFNRNRGEDIRKHWQLIDKDVDVLITHTPPFGILDRTISGGHSGCEDLLKAVNRIKPRYHLFGHIHEAYGTVQSGETTFVNGSVLDDLDVMRNEPVVLKYLKK